MSLAIPDIQTFKSMTVASAFLLTYDYICTLDQEIKYVWSQPRTFSISLILFVLNRYMPFIDTFLLLNMQTSVNSAEKCAISSKIVVWMGFAGIALAEFILMLRTWAIWEKNRAIFITFLFASWGLFTPAGYFLHRSTQDTYYFEIAGEAGCFALAKAPDQRKMSLIIGFILLATTESLIAVLTIVKATQHLRRSRAKWVVQLYKDGLLFFVVLLSISLANVISPLIKPSLSTWLATPQRVLHSLLCNRVLFLIFRSHIDINSEEIPATRAGPLTSVIDESRFSLEMDCFERDARSYL